MRAHTHTHMCTHTRARAHKHTHARKAHVCAGIHTNAHKYMGPAGIAQAPTPPAGLPASQAQAQANAQAHLMSLYRAARRVYRKV